MIRNSTDETNFPHKLLLTDTQVSKICKAFSKDISANITFAKIQSSKMIQPGEFFADKTGIICGLGNFVNFVIARILF